MTKGLESLKKAEFEAGDFLFQEGDVNFHFYIIQKGEVEILLKRQPSQELVSIATLGPGQAVGEFALVSRKPRSASARAKTKVSAIKVSEEGYAKLLQELPEWSRAVLESLIERIRYTDEILRNHKTDNSATQTMISKALDIYST
jgi:CRP/FNR family cyclic AMP-dependent transcriptional regulator